MAWHTFGLARISALEYSCLPENSFLEGAKFWWCHLEKVTTFLLRVDRTFFALNPKTKNMWIICVATISSEICLSYLGKVFGNVDVVFVNSTGTSCWPKTNLTFFNVLLLIKGNIFLPLWNRLNYSRFILHLHLQLSFKRIICVLCHF